MVFLYCFIGAHIRDDFFWPPTSSPTCNHAIPGNLLQKHEYMGALCMSMDTSIFV